GVGRRRGPGAAGAGGRGGSPGLGGGLGRGGRAQETAGDAPDRTSRPGRNRGRATRGPGWGRGGAAGRRPRGCRPPRKAAGAARPRRGPARTCRIPARRSAGGPTPASLARSRVCYRRRTPRILLVPVVVILLRRAKPVRPAILPQLSVGR